MRLLLVEDDAKIAAFIEKGLRAAGYAVDHAADGETGLHLALTEPYDAAIVDIMLPKRDGLSLITALRKNRINTPVLILSARDSVDDRVQGLHTGGDDYLTKPFAFAELLARVQALMRRASGLAEPTQLIVGNLSLNLLTREVSRDGYIVTNNHVVEDANQIKVKLANGKEYDGKVIGRDPKTDLALVKIDGATDLHALPMGNSETEAK